MSFKNLFKNVSYIMNQLFLAFRARKGSVCRRIKFCEKYKRHFRIINFNFNFHSVYGTRKTKVFGVYY